MPHQSCHGRSLVTLPWCSFVAQAEKPTAAAAGLHGPFRVGLQQCSGEGDLLRADSQSIDHLSTGLPAWPPATNQLFLAEGCVRPQALNLWLYIMITEEVHKK